MCCHYTILHRRVLLYNAFHEIANGFLRIDKKYFFPKNKKDI